MSEETTPPPIRFSCSHCAMELSVPAELSGVSGPCPGCGGLIQSPAPFVEPAAAPVPVEVVPAAKPGVQGARRLAPQPRQIRVRKESPPVEEPVGPLMETALPPRRTSRSGPGRAIYPVAGLSSKYEDEKERGAVIRVALAVLVTIALVVVIFFMVTSSIEA